MLQVLYNWLLTHGIKIICIVFITFLAIKISRKIVGKTIRKADFIKPIRVVGSESDDFGTNGMDIKVLGETKHLKQWNILREFRKRLKISFDKQGVEIPFSQILVWIREK